MIDQSKIRALAEAQAREANRAVRKVRQERIQFEWRGGCLEGGTATGDREWCWWQGDAAVVVTDGGVITGSIDVPEGAGVIQEKGIIRAAAKGS